MRSSSQSDLQKSERREGAGRTIPVHELEKLSAVLLNNARSSPPEFYSGVLGGARLGQVPVQVC